MSAALNVLPPSPPRTTSRKYVVHAEGIEQKHSVSNLENILSTNNAPLGTPDESPASFPGSGSGSGRNRKRVEFSPYTNIHDPPTFTTSSPHQFTVKPIPPSRECSSSASILKISSQPELSPQDNGNEQKKQTTLVDMLGSILQQLSRNDGADSIDAYRTLASTLKAYSVVLDSHNLKSKLGALLQHVRRDLMVIDKSENGPADINLVTQALKVLVILAWNRNFSTLLSNDNQAFILDRAIQTIEEHKAPKGVLLHYLHLLATQDFRQTVMTTARVTRLQDALKDLTNHVKGNGAASERLMVYQRLIDQVRPSMKAKPTPWIQALLDGLVSQMKDTRTKAVDLGTKAMAAFPSSSTISCALRDVLETILEDGKTNSASACRRLEKLLNSKEEGLMVPQIWAVVLSLLRGLVGGVDKWTGLKDWLKVIQKCFNCSNPAIRSQANLAWNRFVYVVRPSDATESLLSMLIKPIAAQMDRKSGENEDRSTRATAFAAYCNLLYYAFRPAASHKQYDRVWDQYVLKVMTQSFFDKAPTNADRACRIFMALYWNDNSKSKLWREIRAQENATMEPEELPTIDCKWIRANTSSILGIFKMLFRSSSWGSAGSPDQAFVAAAWRHFAKALGDAGRKEMKPSTETIHTLTEVLMFLSDLWKSGPTSLKAADENSKDAFLTRFRFVCMTVLTEIGPIPFVEGTLPIELPTASKDTHTASERRESPIIQLIGVISTVSRGITTNVAYYDLVKEILQLPRQARMPTVLRVRLLRKCADSVPARDLPAPLDDANEYIWRVIASLAYAAIDDLSSETLADADFEIDALREDILRILEIGVACSSSSDEIWCTLLAKFVALAKQPEEGSVARIWSTVRCLATCLKKQSSDRLTTKVAELTLHIIPLIHMPVTESRSRPSSGNSRAKMSHATPAPFEKLLFLLHHQLEQAYTATTSDQQTVIPRVTLAVCQCLKLCPADTTDRWLKIMEPGLCLWLEDRQRLLTSSSPIGLVKLIEGRKMCTLVIGVLTVHSERRDSLAQIHKFLTAGFSSTHKMTINQMVDMWNSTFCTKKQLIYPEPLNAALERLRPYVDLELPNFNTDTEDEALTDLPVFIDSQEDKGIEYIRTTEATHKRATSLAGSSPAGLLLWKEPSRLKSIATSRASPTIDRFTPLRAVPKLKLRHDDSQVNYISVESSPLQDRPIDSQLLTDRQKEIRAQQQAEAAVMFPDLRPNPSGSLPVLRSSAADTLTTAIIQEDNVTREAPATPTLPAQTNGDLDDMMPSSPTPQSKRPALRLDEIEVPSSPPSMPGFSGYEESGELELEPATRTANTTLSVEVLPTVSHAHMHHSTIFAPHEIYDDVSKFDRNWQGQSIPVEALEHKEVLPDAATDVDPLELSAMLCNASGSEVPVAHAAVVNSNFANSEIAGGNVVDAPQVHETHIIPGDNMPDSSEVVRDDSVEQTTELVETEFQDHTKDKHCAIRNDDASYMDKVVTAEPKDQAIKDVSMVDALRFEAAPPQVILREEPTEDIPPAHAHLPEAKSDCQLSLEMPIEDVASAQRLVTDPVQTPLTNGNEQSDSDEVDMLSASQLSQDLDWHIEVEARTSQVAMSPGVGVEHNFRKRKRSVGTPTGTKRRKDAVSPVHTRCQVPPSSSEPEEILECITVDTTPRQLRAVSTSTSQEGYQDQSASQAGKRKRGRPRKQKPSTPSRPVSEITAVREPLALSLAVKDMQSEERVPYMKAECPLLKEDALPGSVEWGDGSRLYKDLAQGVENIDPALEITSVNQETPTVIEPRPVEEHVISPGSPSTERPTDLPGGMRLIQDPAMTATREWAEVGSQTEAVVVEGRGGKSSMDIICTLRNVLHHLKSATLGRSALRDVDDLLFEIRTEAQNAVGRT